MTRELEGARFGFCIARRLFAAAFGAVFLAAFISLGVQVRGLFGEHGIVPAKEFLSWAGRQLGNGACWHVPSLLWVDASDGMLVGFCVAGAILSCGIIAGVAPGACTLICWALYLSLCSVGSPFLNFQWDILLLETALLATFWLPWRLRPVWSIETLGQKFARWLLWWLLFRLMLESGMVKLTWGDQTWWELRALEYHFETQPLPLWTAWYAHQMPVWLLRAITFVMFIVEMGAPFLLAAPRRWRHGAGIALAALQVGILLTGNYAFFNWLSLALCVTVFDDCFFQRRPGEQSRHLPAPTWPPWRIGLALTAAAVAFVLTLPGLFQAFRLELPQPLAEFRSFNGYGLFRVMTTERPEVVIEGSNDGVTWSEYQFPWKPGDLRRRPGLVAPHQPRVDWQMWFAALAKVDQEHFSHLRYNQWFLNLIARTLQGSPEVLAFYAWNPFPNQPPRAIRAVLYDYHFSHPGESGWWRRERLGLYCPPISLSTVEAGQKSSP